MRLSTHKLFLSRAGIAGMLSAVALTFGFTSGASADAGSLPSCGPGGALCSFSLTVDGENLGRFNYLIGAGGDISLPTAISLTLDDGATIGVGSVFGNADPVVGVDGSAGTLANGHDFTFSFDLPINLGGQIFANSSISYSLTAKTDAGAEIKPLLPGRKVLIAQEVDTSVGGLDSLDKRVDAGDRFAMLPGSGTFPRTENSAVFTNSSSFIGDTRYDVMNAVVAFTLSPQSNVGFSGFVQQVIPEPSTYALLAAGLAFIGFVARRRLSA